MAQITDYSLRHMAVAIREKRISSVELVRAHLDRIEQVNPALNAVVEVRAAAALEAAATADRELASGRPAGPLHGVPMTVKGAWDARGFTNTGGTLGRRTHVASQDATVIARLKAAGMIPIATTNLPEFSLALESDNIVYGRTNNPYHLDRSPGGSGGGGAAAIAASCSPFEVGGDLGGSIRVPAHCCGIAGLKPTLGRVPLSGYFPGPFGVVTLLSTAGPMARFVDDLILTYPLLAGPDWVDLSAVDAILHEPHTVDVHTLKIAFHANNGVVPVTAETAGVIERAARAMADFGCSLEHDRPAGLEQGSEIFLSLLSADGGEGLRYLIRESNTDELSPLCAGLLDFVKDGRITGPEYGMLLVRRDVYRTQIASFFSRYDAILCPVLPFPAFRHGESLTNLPAFSYAYIYNVAGCPAAVVRCGTSEDGLPIGVQIVAAPWKEHIALAIACQLEKAFGGWQKPAL